MKTLARPITQALLLIVLLASINASGQTVYTISANQNWSAGGYGSYCGNCQFNISSGVTLTLNTAWSTCANCKFTGGKLSVTQPFTCQGCTFSSDSVTVAGTTLNLQSSLSSFTGVFVNATGAATISATAPVNISNSTMNFAGTSSFSNSGGPLNLNASYLVFNGNSNFQATAGAVSLSNSSSLTAGDGSLGSAAYIYMNGPALNINDNSIVAVANKNNYYFNWSSYSTSSGSVSTFPSTLNCGGANPHACSSPYVYGCATFSAAGTVACTILAISADNFAAVKQDDGSVLLSWTAQQQSDLNHFVVERSSDGSNWNEIGQVDAQTSSSTVNNYSYKDNSPLAGISFYRLEMVNSSQTSSFSETIAVKNMQLSNSITGIFPNPIVNQNFNIRVASPDACLLNVYTFSGQLLYTASLQGQLIYSIKLPNNAPVNTSLVVQIISKGNTESFTVLSK